MFSLYFKTGSSRFRAGVPASLLLAAAALGLGACSSPPSDGSTSVSKRGILRDVDNALTNEDCATAVALIEPLLNSASTDNEVRLKAASAYGCYARVNFFSLVGDLLSAGPSLAGSALWSTLTQLFPSTAGSDYVPEGALLAIDALQATLTPGALVLPVNKVNAGSYNVGSVFTTDRTSDANIYLAFIAMAGIGGLQNRYGSPDPGTFIKTVDLPWTTAVSMAGSSDGCAYASSVLNMVDAIESAQYYVSDELAQVYANMAATFNTALDTACTIACENRMPTVPESAIVGAGWTVSGCTVGTCSECPSSLRARANCTGAVDDLSSCAAAGIVNFINESTVGWN